LTLPYRDITCILCPVGCRITVTITGDAITDVAGHACLRGEEYARQEVQQPRRIVISVVRCMYGDIPTVSVKTTKAIPRDRIREVMDALCAVQVTAPVVSGEVICRNVCGLGTDVVATRSVHQC
jgi:CxxC motif-containing protein